MNEKYKMFTSDDDAKLEKWMNARWLEDYQFCHAIVGGENNMFTTIIMEKKV